MVGTTVTTTADLVIITAPNTTIIEYLVSANLAGGTAGGVWLTTDVKESEKDHYMADQSWVDEAWEKAKREYNESRNSTVPTTTTK